MKEIAKAILSVMEEVKGIDKSLSVGTGRSSYKGVSDKDVRLKVGAAMKKNGLCIMPIEVEASIKVDRWEQEETWNNKTQLKQKQSVFTDVKTKYLLLHKSGESQEVAGYGHGVDSQDKGAGKATTYALKNTLLALFLVPTGIEDTENTHSNDLPVPKKKKKPVKKVAYMTQTQFKKIKELHVKTGRALKATADSYSTKKFSELRKAQAVKLIEYLESLPEATLQ